jgi:chemotaxis protein MotB
LARILEGHEKETHKHERVAADLMRVNQDLNSQIRSLTTQLQLTRTGFQDLDREKERLAREIKTISASADEIEKSKQQAQRSLQIKEEIIRSLQREIADGQLKIVQLANRTTIRLEEKIFFDSGRATIKSSGLAILDKIGRILKQIQDRHIQVEGHTDSRPLRWQLRARFPSNWELSAARAAVIVRYLVDKAGIDPSRVSAAGYAFHRPVVPEETPEGQRKNRRVEFALFPIEHMNPN